MPQIPTVPTIDLSLNFQQDALEQGDTTAVSTKTASTLTQIDEYRSQVAASVNGLNVAIEYINAALDAFGIDIPAEIGIPPNIPNLRLTSGTSTSLTVHWDRPDETNVLRYLIYRRLEGIGEFALIINAGLIGGFPLGYATQINLQPSTTYEIGVRTLSPTGVEGAMSVVTGTTPSA